MEGINLRLGKERSLTFKIEEEHVAKHLGNGKLGVLSTPSMIAFMEFTAMLCVQDDLLKGYTTVGTKVCVEHVSPVPLGEEVVVRARLKEIRGKEINFRCGNFMEG